MVETSDAADHEVLEELQRGYKYEGPFAASSDGEGRQESLKSSDRPQERRQSSGPSVSPMISVKER